MRVSNTCCLPPWPSGPCNWCTSTMAMFSLSLSDVTSYQTFLNVWRREKKDSITCRSIKARGTVTLPGNVTGQR